MATRKVVLTTKPIDVPAQIASEQRRRMLAEQLMAYRPSETVGGAIGHGIAQLGGALMARGATRREQELQAQLKEQRNAALRSMYADALEGKQPTSPIAPELQSIGARLAALDSYLGAGGDPTLAQFAWKAGQPDRPDLPQSAREFEYARENGYTGTFEDWTGRQGNVAQAAMLQEYGLYKQQQEQAGQQPLDLLSYIRERNRSDPALRFGSAPALGSFVFDPSRNAQSPITQLTTPEQEAEATAATAQREAEARAEGQAAGQRAATLNADLVRIDDEIERTQRLLGEFRAGKYQTGPIAGRLPNFRTAAQELSREQGKDVISAISSATFGALSEGEREFLRNIGISETATEEANISLLEQRERELKRARDRLRSQGLAGASGGPLAPGQTATIGGVKITRTK